MPKKSSVVDEGVAASSRPTRVTRSQSAEPQSTLPVATSKSKGSASTARNRGRKPKEATHLAAGLHTVDEDAKANDDEQPPAQAEDGVSGGLRSVSAGSGYSGTTAKTSFSQQEIAELDPEDMIDVLQRLAIASDDLAAFLAPAGADTLPEHWKEIRRTESKLHKRYRNRVAPVVTDKPFFGTQEYIQPAFVLRAFFGAKSADEVPAEAWRAKDILCSINMAQMLKSLLIDSNPRDWTPANTDALSRLEISLPRDIAGEHHEAALDLYLSVASQLVIARLEDALGSGAPFSPFDVVNTILWDDGDFRHLEAFGLEAMADEERSSALGKIHALAEELTREVHQDASAAVGRLKSVFPWEQLRLNALRFQALRKSQIDARVAQAGGIARITDGLAREVERRAAGKARARKSISKEDIPTMQNFSGKATKAALNKRRKKATQEVPPAPSVPAAGDPAIDPNLDNGNAYDGSMPPDEDDEMPPATANQPRQTGSETMGGLEDLRAFQDLQKRNVRPLKSFRDAQEEAVQIPFEDELEQEQPAPRPAPAQSRPVALPVSSGSRKRPADDDDNDLGFDPTQEGYESDHRDLEAADRRREQIRALPRRPRGNEPSSSAPRPSASSAAPSGRSRKNPGSSVPLPTQPRNPEDPDLEDDQWYARQTVKARLNNVTWSQSKPPQTRNPWTEEECNALIDLIKENGEDGISWAVIKRIDEARGDEALLSARKAEDLRFKARNMKETMLLAGARPPANWHYVVLPKGMLDKLAARGVEYHQDAIRASAMDQ